MNAIFFGLKRAYHAPLRVFNRKLEPSGLTCARFDLLHALRAGKDVSQRYLRDWLGVSAPTVSRMLKSLEKLGIIARRRVDWDARQRWVSITGEGRRRYLRALDWKRCFWIAITAFLDERGVRDRVERFLATDQMEMYCRGVRDAFRDRSSVRYPWHPDD